MGACTVTVVDNDVFGGERVVFGRIAGSSSYAAGGDTFTAAAVGLSTIDKMTVTPSILVSSKAFVGVVIPTTGASPAGTFPATAGKLALIGASAAAGGLGEPTGDVSAFIFEFIAYGA